MYVKYCSVASLVTVQLDTIFPWAVSMACTLLGREWVRVIFTLVLTTHCISWSCSLYSSKVFGGWKALVANFYGWCLYLYYLLKIYNSVTCLIGKAKEMLWLSGSLRLLKWEKEQSPRVKCESYYICLAGAKGLVQFTLCISAAVVILLGYSAWKSRAKGSKHPCWLKRKIGYFEDKYFAPLI